MKHAKLSASSSHRWLAMPPIIKLEEEFPNKSSVYAREGTDAHTLSELKLRKFKGEDVEGEIDNFITNSSFYNEEIEQATDLFVDMVIEQFNNHEKATLDLEQRVKFDKWVPGGFGTSDVVIASEKVIEIIDLKYGKGVMVHAYQNPQLMLYALGSYDAYEWLFNFETVRMTIIQPRLDHISTHEVSVEELLYWANNYVAPRAAQADIGIGEWDIETDALKFSPVRATLRPRAEQNMAFIEDFNFEDPQLLDNGEIAKVLAQANEIKSWIKDVESYATSELLKGNDLPGYKLVEGRSSRKITDEEGLAKVLVSSGYEDIYKPTQLESLTNLEKYVGKKKFNELSEGYIEKPQGKPKIAPADDKRPEYNSAELDFA